MTEKMQLDRQERKESIEDNARKFTLDEIDAEFLTEHGAVSHQLVVDWLVTEEINEKKIVRKELENREVQYLLIEKKTLGGNRTTDKRKISEDEYKKLLESATVHLEKKRYEFSFTQDDASFSIKYDEFPPNNFCLLEVDAKSEADRNRFDYASFPYKLSEVTGDPQYQGYRAAQFGV